VRLLLDTHIVLWWIGEPRRLRSPLRRTIEKATVAYVSAASIWEASIKAAAGRLKTPEGLAALLVDQGFRELPISFHHAEAAATLPDLHKDPFDRMLIAQARSESLVLVTSDVTIRRYDVRTLWD